MVTAYETYQGTGHRQQPYEFMKSLSIDLSLSHVGGMESKYGKSEGASVFTIFVSFSIRLKASLSNHQYNYVYAVGPFGSLLNYS